MTSKRERDLHRSLLATHRHQAHAAFDQLWKTGMMTRQDAYKLLKAWMGVEGVCVAHIGNLSMDECCGLVERVREYISEERDSIYRNRDRYRESFERDRRRMRSRSPGKPKFWATKARQKRSLRHLCGTN